MSPRDTATRGGDNSAPLPILEITRRRKGLTMLTARCFQGGSWQFLVSGLAVAIASAIGGNWLALAEDKGPDQPAQTPRKKYVEDAEQLIVELYVRDVKQSTAFYKQLGFTVVRQEPHFVELGWDDSRLYLEQIAGQAEPPATLVANVRIMVGDVDRYWKHCQEMKLPVKRDIGNRYYGLRDFTVVSPDGIGLRFASKLGKKAAERIPAR
jgi:catechol 2,3-dioxygenase-like lactoylglutathione lyase family enzyme